MNCPPLPPKKDLVAKREKVSARLTQLKDESRQLLDLFQDPKVIEQLGKDKQSNSRLLQENYGVRVCFGSCLPE